MNSMLNRSTFTIKSIVLGCVGVFSALIMPSVQGLMFSNAGETNASAVYSDYSEQAPQVSDSVKPPITFSIDRDFSAFTGADLNHSLYKAYMWGDDRWLPSTRGDRGRVALVGRFLKLCLETGLSSFFMVTQHEVFGHGARAREFNLPIEQYRIGFQAGHVAFSPAKYNVLHRHEKVMFALGGMEANAVLGQKIRREFLTQGSMDVREALLYLNSWFDQTSYVMSIRRHESDSSNIGHDVKAYLVHLNQWHGREVLNAKKLRHRSLLDCLDPFLYFSVSNLGQYLYEGEQAFDYPALEVGGYRYLAALRNQLTPYGTELQWLNFLTTPERQVIQAYVKYGKTGEHKSWGLGAEIREFYSVTSLNQGEAVRLGAKLDLWQQPELLKRANTAHGVSKKFGLGASVLAAYNLSPGLALNAEFGFKAKGYVIGEPLRSNAIFRLGVAFRP